MTRPTTPSPPGGRASNKFRTLFTQVHGIGILGSWYARGCTMHRFATMERKGQREERRDGPTNRRGGAQAARAAGRRMDPRGQAARRAAVAGGGTGDDRMARL